MCVCVMCVCVCGWVVGTASTSSIPLGPVFLGRCCIFPGKVSLFSKASNSFHHLLSTRNSEDSPPPPPPKPPVLFCFKYLGFSLGETGEGGKHPRATTTSSLQIVFDLIQEHHQPGRPSHCCSAQRAGTGSGGCCSIRGNCAPADMGKTFCHSTALGWFPGQP